MGTFCAFSGLFYGWLQSGRCFSGDGVCRWGADISTLRFLSCQWGSLQWYFQACVFFRIQLKFSAGLAGIQFREFHFSSL